MAILIFILIAIFCVAFLTGIIWLILYFPINWITPEKVRNKIRWFISILISLGIIYYYLFTSPAYNHEQARLINRHKYYALILTGERVYLSHDPISSLSRKTFTDTVTIKLPRNKGVINGNEIIIDENDYPFKGKVEIINDVIKVNLYFDNYDNKTKDPLSYNGKYRLRR